jgi:hypothetical protein
MVDNHHTYGWFFWEGDLHWGKMFGSRGDEQPMGTYPEEREKKQKVTGKDLGSLSKPALLIVM